MTHGRRLAPSHSSGKKTNMTMNGRQIEILEQDAVATDVVACLAGVSFGAVVRTIWAINAIHAVAGVSLERLLDTDAVPTQLADDDRRTVTGAVVRALLERPQSRACRRALRLDQRFALKARAVIGP